MALGNLFVNVLLVTMATIVNMLIFIHHLIVTQIHVSMIVFAVPVETHSLVYVKLDLLV